MSTPTILSRLLLFAMLALTAPAMADPVADFYHGKTINLFVSFPPGGGYDIYARVLAPYFTQHIPGNPTIVIKNMEGGSGVKAAGYICAVTPQDGTSLGLFLDVITLGKVLGGTGDFDPVKLAGSAASSPLRRSPWSGTPRRCRRSRRPSATRSSSPASVPSNSSSFIPTALNDLIGTRFKIVRGFSGSPPMALAMERGEVDAIGGMSWEAIQLTKQDWLEQKKAACSIRTARTDQGSAERSRASRFCDRRPRRKLLTLLGSGSDIGRSIVAEPGIPRERAAALRKAFTQTMDDPEFVADMHKHSLNVEALSGRRGAGDRRRRRGNAGRAGATGETLCGAMTAAGVRV